MNYVGSLLLAGSCLAIAACGPSGSENGDSPTSNDDVANNVNDGETTGATNTNNAADAAAHTVVMNFSVSSNVRTASTLKAELDGPIYGALYLSEEVSVTGPIDGAESKDAVELQYVDLREDEVSTEVFTSESLEPGRYTFLGFFDIDENGAESREPDAGDPVTLPVANVFEITGEEQVELTARFDILRP